MYNGYVLVIGDSNVNILFSFYESTKGLHLYQRVVCDQKIFGTLSYKILSVKSTFQQQTITAYVVFIANTVKQCLMFTLIIQLIIQFICIAPESIVLLSGASHNVQIVAKIKLLLK